MLVRSDVTEGDQRVWREHREVLIALSIRLASNMITAQRGTMACERRLAGQPGLPPFHSTIPRHL
jgi:hypothetical protein